MGSSLSCGCDSRRCLTSASASASQCPPSQEASSSRFRFCAELFQLSEDRSQWAIVSPKLLSFTVTELPAKRAVRLTASAADDSRLFVDHLLDSSSQLTRASLCFAYWRYEGETFGVNVLCAEDCERLCSQCMAGTRGECSARDATASAYFPVAFPARISQLFKVHNDSIRHVNSPSADCLVNLNVNSALVRVCGRNFTFNLMESVMVIGEVKEKLYISEPGGAFTLQCDDSKTLRALLSALLTVSSFLLAGTSNFANAAHYLQKQIAKCNDKIASLVRSLGALQPECELARDLGEELEMTQLRIFTLKYRLAALINVPFPPPSDLLSKISLRTLRHMSAFGSATICSLHLHYLCKTPFHIGKRGANRGEELRLNAAALHTDYAHAQRGGVSVMLPSGAVVRVNERADNTIEVLAKVCEKLRLCPEKHCIVRDGKQRMRLVEREYRIEKNDRCLGLTICARQHDGRIKAEVRAVRDVGTPAEVGDVVVRIDDQPVDELSNAEQVESLLRSATSLVLCRTSSHSCPRASTSSHFASHSSPVHRTCSMDCISELSSMSALNQEYQGESAISSPSRSLRHEEGILDVPAMSHSACEGSCGVDCVNDHETYGRYASDERSRRKNSSQNSRSEGTDETSRRGDPLGESFRREVTTEERSRREGLDLRKDRRDVDELSSRRETVVDDKYSKREIVDDRRHLNGSAVIQCAPFSDSAREQLLNTIHELVLTEENFVRDIQKLVTQYLRPTNMPILETADRLLRVQTSFLCSLLDAAGDVAHSCIASQQQLRDSLIRISALFVNKCSKFKIYSEYSAAYLRFQQCKKEKSEIESRLEKMNVSKEQSESAQSLLIKPIQRVLKYPLFLQQMRDNCVSGSMERQQGEQALARMHALAEYVNEMQRLTEQYGPAIDEISAKNAAGARMNFSQLLMFAHVSWLNCSENRSRPVPCVAFVFTSLILILCPNLSKSKSRVYRILPIAEIEVNESHGSSAQQQFLFVLIHVGSPREPVYHLCCCQAEVKNQFIKSIRKAVATLAKEQRRPLSGSSQSDGGYSSELHAP